MRMLRGQLCLQFTCVSSLPDQPETWPLVDYLTHTWRSSELSQPRRRVLYNELLPEGHEVILELIREVGVEFGRIAESKSDPSGDGDGDG
jgi:hypothetical protein